MMPCTCSPVSPSDRAELGRGLLERHVDAHGRVGVVGIGLLAHDGTRARVLRRDGDVVAHHAVGEHVAVRVDDVAARAVHGHVGRTPALAPPRSAPRRARPGCRRVARRTRRRGRPARRPRGGSAASGVGCVRFIPAFLVGSVRGGRRQAVARAAAERPAARRALRPTPPPVSPRSESAPAAVPSRAARR